MQRVFSQFATTRAVTIVVALCLVALGTISNLTPAMASVPAFPGTMAISGSGTCTGIAIGNSVPVTFSVTRYAAPDPNDGVMDRGGIVAGSAGAYTSYELPGSELSLPVGGSGTVSRTYVLTADEAATLAATGTVSIPLQVAAVIMDPDVNDVFAQSGTGTLVITGCQEVLPTEVPTEMPTAVPTETPVPTEVPTETPAPTVAPTVVFSDEIPTETPVVTATTVPPTVVPTEAPTEVATTTPEQTPFQAVTEVPTETTVPSTETPVSTETPASTSTPTGDMTATTTPDGGTGNPATPIAGLPVTGASTPSNDGTTYVALAAAAVLLGIGATLIKRNRPQA